MDEVLQKALKQLSESSFYEVTYAEFIIPEMRKLLILDENLDTEWDDKDFKLEIKAQIKAYKKLEDIFDKINSYKNLKINPSNNQEMI